MGAFPPCRSCGENGLNLILSLGRTPLANALLTESQLEDEEPRYPLDLAFCTSCSLVQITETVPPEALFREYVYFSSFSDTTLEHARQLTERLRASRRLTAKSLVVEVASNDGYLLRHYQRAGVPVLGVEPARNIARVAEEAGIPTVPEFFDASLAQELRERTGAADVIHANNVLAHVPALSDFVKGIRVLLKEDGIAVIEVPYVKDLVDGVEFDTVYHEHLCYFALTPVARLFERHGLSVIDVERLPIHGGSLRIFAGVAGGSGEHSPAVERLLQEEEASGVNGFDFYREFGGRVEALRARVLSFLAGLKDEKRRIAAYGASAKGTTLLSYFGIGNETLDFVVDRSTAKQGRYTPGTHLPIHPPEKLLELMPHYVLLLTWNFAEEVLAQQAEYRRKGGRFVIPVPELRVV